jgi:uncharacterized protein YodC (DUF2158 family)
MPVQSSETKAKIGMVVQSVAGGPMMTIVRDDGIDWVLCYWFPPGSSDLRKERFSFQSLRVVWDGQPSSPVPDELTEYRKNWE